VISIGSTVGLLLAGFFNALGSIRRMSDGPGRNRSLGALSVRGRPALCAAAEFTAPFLPIALARIVSSRAKAVKLPFQRQETRV
jgi:hypothetical protein